MKGNKVVVTGLGAVTPLGLDVATSWQGICAGASGAANIDQFDASAERYVLATGAGAREAAHSRDGLNSSGTYHTGMLYSTYDTVCQNPKMLKCSMFAVRQSLGSPFTRNSLLVI